MLGFKDRADRERLVGVLDIGSFKIMCVIAVVSGRSGSAEQRVRVHGVGTQRSLGIKGGVVIDPAAAEGVIRAAVAKAERAAGVTLSEVVVSVSCGRLKSIGFAAHADIGRFGVGQGDIARLYDGAMAYVERDGRVLVHMNRKTFLLDGAAAGDDPRGLAARRLTANIHAVTSDDNALRNVGHVVERCHLAVSGFVAAGYASALAVTDPDERQLGVTVIDMGGGTTSLAVFHHGQFVHTQVVPTGGQHLTFDIAQNLHAPLAEAERIKSLYASMVNAPSDMSDRFSYAVAGDREGATVETTRAHLSAIVRPRVEALLRDVETRVNDAGVALGRVVITGGASQLVGMAECAGSILGCEVRRGEPRGALGVSTATDTAASSTVVGLLLAAPDGQAGVDKIRGGSGYFSRVSRWMGHGF